MKIQIIGASGSGKSTLARHISEKTGAFWIDTDRYLWKDDNYTENYPVEERLAMYRHDLDIHQDYVISGSVHSWNPDGFMYKDLLVFLIIDEQIRQKRLYDREYARYGARMLPGGDHYELTQEFLDWCKQYYTDDEDSPGSYMNHLLQIKKAACPTLVLDANEEVDILLQRVLAAYDKRSGADI